MTRKSFCWYKPNAPRWPPRTISFCSILVSLRFCDLLCVFVWRCLYHLESKEEKKDDNTFMHMYVFREILERTAVALFLSIPDLSNAK